MTINEAIKNIKSDGAYTDDNIKSLRDALFESQPKDFHDESVRMFMKFINSISFDNRIQDVLSELVEYMQNKGVDIPCAHGCDDTCEFHEEEFD